MKRECFYQLCNLIEEKVGADMFKFEKYLSQLMEENSLVGRMAKANTLASGGYVCGKMKIAVTLRLLAGGSYLDLFLIYDLFDTYPYTILHETVSIWFCNDNIISINGKEYLNDH